MSEWRPLDSYPGENLRVLVRRVDAPHRSRWHHPQPIIVAYSKTGERWYSEPGMYQTYPTHWMPLPEPPR